MAPAPASIPANRSASGLDPSGGPQACRKGSLDSARSGSGRSNQIRLMERCWVRWARNASAFRPDQAWTSTRKSTPGRLPRGSPAPISSGRNGGVHSSRVTRWGSPASGSQRGSAAAAMASEVNRLMAI